MAATRIVLHYPKTMIDQPVVYHLARDYHLMFNILRADITPDAEGLMVLELSGDATDLERGLDYARQAGVRVQPLGNDVTRDEDVCTHCGACVTICPTAALAIDVKSREVAFDPEKCIACELCVPVCPPHAMRVQF
jgi:ferredoxin